MIKFKQRGDFHRLNSFLEKSLESVNIGLLNKYGRKGVAALETATPKDSEKTANSWSYEIERTNNSVKLIWSNNHVVNGCNIAVILQYGHATRNGSWVEGVDYINPALRPIFEEISKAAWKEVIQ